MLVNGLGYAHAGSSKFSTAGSTTSGEGATSRVGSSIAPANVPAMSRFVIVSASTSYTGMAGKALLANSLHD